MGSIPGPVRAFLDAAGRFAVVATVGTRGRPHQSVVWYALRGEDVLVNGSAVRIWVNNARRDGWLSITVADGYEYAILSGPVTVIDEPARALEDIRALARRYGQSDSAFEGQHRITVLLHPERIATHGALAAP